MTIRPAAPGDETTLLALIAALARFEKLDHMVSATADALREHLFGPRPACEAILAEEGIGGSLLAEVRRLERVRGCGRLEWSVLDWNANAIAFCEQGQRSVRAVLAALLFAGAAAIIVVAVLCASCGGKTRTTESSGAAGSTGQAGSAAGGGGTTERDGGAAGTTGRGGADGGAAGTTGGGGTGGGAAGTTGGGGAGGAPATFGCGADTCMAGKTFCYSYASGISGGGTSRSCTALPAACAKTPTCACVCPPIGGPTIGCTYYGPFGSASCSCTERDGQMTVSCAAS
jgi:hypothetical protein